MTPSLYQACRQAVHVLTADGRILRAGRAVLFIFEEIGYFPPLIRALKRIPLVWWVEFGYWLVANHRPFFSKFLFTTGEES